MDKMDMKAKIEMDAKRTTSEERRTVWLHREGNFFRMFDRSTWLHANVIYDEEYRKSIGASNPITVSKARAKSVGDYIVSGFPISSIDKYAGGLPFDMVDDRLAKIVIPADLDMGFSEEEYDVRYAEYFASVKMSKQAKSDTVEMADGTQVVVRGGCRRGAFDILRELLLYPVVERTPVEAVEFIREIQRDLKRLM